MNTLPMPDDDILTMTDAERDAEVAYRVQERLGMMCGAEDPTLEQLAIAQDEAQDWLAKSYGL